MMVLETLQGHWSLKTSAVQIQGPLGAEGDSLRLCLTGTFYNLNDLRAALRRAGRKTSASAGDILLACFAHWGTEALARLNGAFALAVFDTDAHRLWLARDPAGQIPLWYRQDPDGLRFSSDLDALRGVDSDATPDTTALARLIADGVMPSGASAWTGIRSVPPGALVEIGSDSEPRLCENHADPAQAIEPVLTMGYAQARLLAFLDDATRRRLKASDALQVVMSEGAADAAVLGLASLYEQTPLQSHAIGEDMAYQVTATRFGARQSASGRVLDADAVSQVLKRTGQPFADPALLGLVQAARDLREAKGLLSGLGAEILLDGRSVFPAGLTLSIHAPFLDPRLVAFVAALPASFDRAALFRATLSPLLGTAGVSAPPPDVRAVLQALAADLLPLGEVQAQGLLCGLETDDLSQAPSWRLLALISSELWLRQHSQTLAGARTS